MTEQLELRIGATCRLEQEFLVWKATEQAGQVCNRFLRIAWGFHLRGQKVGAKAIVERIRWSMMCRRDPDRRFLVNNNLTAYLARWAMEAEPKLAGFFETRETGSTPTARQLARRIHGVVAAATSAALQGFQKVAG